MVVFHRPIEHFDYSMPLSYWDRQYNWFGCLTQGFLFSFFHQQNLFSPPKWTSTAAREKGNKNQFSFPLALDSDPLYSLNTMLLLEFGMPDWLMEKKQTSIFCLRPALIQSYSFPFRFQSQNNLEKGICLFAGCPFLLQTTSRKWRTFMSSD